MTDRLHVTARERELIRREFITRPGSTPRLDEGIMQRRWAGGPNQGRIKVSRTEQGMVERGLIEICGDRGAWPVARLTAAGLGALRQMAADPRPPDPAKFRHLIDELPSLDRPPWPK